MTKPSNSKQRDGVRVVINKFWSLRFGIYLEFGACALEFGS
jgi:hypothetical protein